ncbi:eukaryotic translation initiation factor 4E type 2 isoform X2 [Pseudonaja textilis]|uniref:eukaryotic translation initiation factor 4E type 2 isoform X2 n=1 Tax=Pseudonaja textilis TaxID=8673 RepID=UPI000EAA89F0|nr:eukaryotic translation initiation factor 4E type 2 isoform X2 [Pseudonaja textilis]
MNNKFDALKDDDSGDHDQNEENSTQKDGEKEKNDKDKSQNSTKRKAAVPGPAEHPLQYNYTFWYSRRTPGRPTSSQSYEQNIKQIGTFASVEQFWRFYSHMVRPGDLTGHSDFHLFKEGIKPMWEDDANKNGGKWIIRLRKGLASRCWENLILAMLGEQFMVGEEICGAVVSVRFQEDIISIWNKTASDQATTARIRDTLRRVLNLPPNTIMEYKTHTDSIKYVLRGAEGWAVAGMRLVPCPYGPKGCLNPKTSRVHVLSGGDQGCEPLSSAICKLSILKKQNKNNPLHPPQNCYCSPQNSCFAPQILGQLFKKILSD